MNDTTSKNAMVNNKVIVLGSLVRVCDVDSSWLGWVTWIDGQVATVKSISSGNCWAIPLHRIYMETN